MPAEREAVANAVERRRLEFATARGCARRALAELGLPATAIPRGRRGAPVWPEGIVGSITHCEGYRASAVARRANIAALGIDAEPNAPLPPLVLERIAVTAELERDAELAASTPQVHWGRLLFSAKECVYKSWFPLAGERLGFADADVLLRPDGSFAARLASPPSRGERTSLAGRWALADGVLLTAIAAPTGS